jgi:glutamate synthase domain-containing protein 2/glutamate synthase domain-containing protein 1/glutamate synthase domain-containing protein 3
MEMDPLRHFNPHLEKSACGVGFIANRTNQASHEILKKGLSALHCVEHRGACASDGITADGSGITTDLPFELLGVQPGTAAVAQLFTPLEQERKEKSLRVFESCFAVYGLEVSGYREVPVNPHVLGAQAAQTRPGIIQAVIKRPEYCTTDYSFERLLHTAKQLTRTKMREAGIVREFFFTSLSPYTIVYKALTTGGDLQRFYLDLQNPNFKTRFALFHRRFSTNTISTWDKAQPFRLIAHNGEINTIAGNRSWAYAREKALGVRPDELLTHKGISDSGSVNEMAEALRFRSSMPHLEDVLAIMMPPAYAKSDFYRFWSRAMEPWDGPALMVYSDGRDLGARLDRNGFRPCRWVLTENEFGVSSEAGVFLYPDEKILAKGTLAAGTGVSMEIESGEVKFRDPGESREYFDARMDARVLPLERTTSFQGVVRASSAPLFGYTQEDVQRHLIPMATEGKEAIGSMGDTAAIAILSDQYRPLFDYFYQNFAQVTNPPLDFLREKPVTDLTTFLGPKPNIFEAKELVPLPINFELTGPVLSQAQMEFLYSFSEPATGPHRVSSAVINTLFPAGHGPGTLELRLKQLADEAVAAVSNGAAILILSDRLASKEQLPVPSLLALRAVAKGLNDRGLRLNTSLVVDSGEVRSVHHVACIIGFGAAAVCPWLAFQVARTFSNAKLSEVLEPQREANIIKAFEQGLLKIMSKSGISVVRSYQTSKLFTALGLDQHLVETYFPGVASPVNGLTLDDLAARIEAHALSEELDSGKLPNTYQFQEHAKGAAGERHAMTIARSRIIHKIVQDKGLDLNSDQLFKEYLEHGEQASPVSVRHLLSIRKADQPHALDHVEATESITRRFGSGAMSFGAISAESQRDIIDAMKELGGRSNSGEGGENPYYYITGAHASVKQVASGRFGVTAQYLTAGREIQIKVAQGAKPGEGGQLMSVKVNEDIAKARHSLPGIDLISPPPLHDIYSIEDLKQLIYELREVHPEALISVKLVSGFGIGTIAVGVAKAGADIIHVAGWDGGTGAAGLTSMKHAGLPWEIGLSEVHQALVENHLRDRVILRTDGGMHSGTDIVMAAMMGADEFDFGKLLLVAEGCMMARICEKGTCPTGIATHDPKYKAKYKGQKEHVVKVLRMIADDARRVLAEAGLSSIDEAFGRADLLQINPRHKDLVETRHIDLVPMMRRVYTTQRRMLQYEHRLSRLNETIVRDAQDALEGLAPVQLRYKVVNTDRAVLAGLSGVIGRKKHQTVLAGISGEQAPSAVKPVTIKMEGAAGQGFAAFLTGPVSVKLTGEANDSVCKSMSEGHVVIVPPKNVKYDPSTNAIIGNVALYGATGGTLFVYGKAGDRFAVRNSGATAVVEQAGLHACEYMTNGTVVILGATSFNVGAGMTGGRLFMLDAEKTKINQEYIAESAFSAEESEELRKLLQAYVAETGSKRAAEVLENWERSVSRFSCWRPKAVVAAMREAAASGQQVA